MTKAAEAPKLKAHQPDKAWLAKHNEEILEPGLPIVDPHHHMWTFDDWQYLFPELLADTSSGHNIVATVAVDSHAMYRADGPAELRPVGETEFVNGIAAQSASGHYGPARLCAGIVGWVELRLGSRVQPVLEAHIRAGGDRFKGVRYVAVWDEDPAAIGVPAGWTGIARHLYAQADFRAGFACLAPLGLTFDVALLHAQLPDLVDLARAFPETKIVLDHVGAPGGMGHYAGRRDEVFADWRQKLRDVAACPNVSVKIGGFGTRIMGFDLKDRAVPPSSEDLVRVWGPYVEATIEAFGPQRCMFESNCPPDELSASYPVIWNGYKRMTAGYSEGERSRMFSGTAAEVYRLDLP